MHGTSAQRRWVLLRIGVVVGVVVALGVTVGAVAGRHPSSLSESGLSSPPGSGAPAPVKAAQGGSGIRLRQVDGGAGYYGKFRSSLPTSASFFPIAVWQEGVGVKADTDLDLDVGLNTYLAPTTNSDLGLIAAAGMYSISSDPRQDGPATAGWFLSDELDMWAGPGDQAWSGRYPGQGEVCNPPGSKCGYSVQREMVNQFPKDGRLRYSNFGKGVTFWETTTEASRFVNEFTDVVSADNYWLTDENICAPSEGGSYFGIRQLSADECHRPSNYGRTVDYVRQFVMPLGSKPVWGFVEVGHPGSNSNPFSAKPPQAAAAVWSNIIHGARGIVYFNHSFGGPCPTEHVLREPCNADMRAAIKRVNNQINSLAPVLNAPFADDVLKASPGVDASVKWYDGNFYVLAASNQTAPQMATLSIPCVGDAQATVLNENRVVSISGGRFADRFADANAVHIYRIDGGSSCGAY